MDELNNQWWYRLIKTFFVLSYTLGFLIVIASASEAYPQRPIYSSSEIGEDGRPMIEAVANALYRPWDYDHKIDWTGDWSEVISILIKGAIIVMLILQVMRGLFFYIFFNQPFWKSALTFR